MTKKQWMILIAAAVALLIIYWIYSRVTAPEAITDAIKSGKVDAKVLAKGNTGRSAVITLSRPKGVSGTSTILIPSGTILYGTDSNTQRLFVATPVQIVLSDVTPAITLQVKTFCFDEFAAIPLQNTAYSFFAPGGTVTTTEETEPLHKLANCLASASQSDADKQLAVWAVSSDWLHKTRDEAVQFVANGLADQMAKERRNQLERKKAHIARKAPHLSSADIDELIEKEYQESMVEAGRIAAAKAQEQITGFIAHDKDMLKSCGYPTDDMPIFR